MKQVPRSSGISSGFRLFFIFSALLALTSSALAGSGQLTSNPSVVNFGSVQVGSSQTQSVTLTNVGSSRLTITQATPSLAVFTLTGLSYPVTLYAGQSVRCNVTFNPQSAVTSNGSVTIAFHNRHNSGTYTMTVPVSGTGVNSGQLTSTPTGLGFGSVTTGSSASLTETLTNSGGTSVTISAASTTGSGFSVSGLTLPTTLTAGQSVSFSTKFSPTAGGAFHRQLGHHFQRCKLHAEHTAHWNGHYPGSAYVNSDKPRLWQRDHRQQRFPHRNSHQLGRYQRHNFRSQRYRLRIQP